MREQPNDLAPARQPAMTWTRLLALATAVVFLVSSAFPAIAGLSKDTASFPAWWGPLDVSVALLLAIMVLTVFALARQQVTRQAEEAAYRAYRFLTHAIFAAMVVFLLVGDRITWINCLPGFAWRTWLLLYSLPVWLTALEGAPGAPPRQSSEDDQSTRHRFASETDLDH
jgi:hypothetical protein